jgi:hypothetical protein
MGGVGGQAIPAMEIESINWMFTTLIGAALTQAWLLSGEQIH